MRILLTFLLILACCLTAAYGQNFTMDRVYNEVLAPRIQQLERDNFNLRVEIMGLMDQIQELQKQLKEAKEPTKQ